MPADQLSISLIQPDIIWEDPQANLRQYEGYLDSLNGRKEVVLLPEMFSTGFTMKPEGLAESMNGATVNWMREMAIRHRCILAGSLVIKEEGQYFNRLVWMQPDGQYGVYDKRHLFAYAGEDEHYTPGNRRLVTSVKGWRLNLQICYDLRFPVWARQTPGNDSEYDVLVYVANWPERRALAWERLLQARAIENQCYVVGVNRVGTDANGHNYLGGSSVFGPGGELLWQGFEAEAKTLVLERQLLDDTRRQLPFLRDADRFMLL